MRKGTFFILAIAALVTASLPCGSGSDDTSEDMSPLSLSASTHVTLVAPTESDRITV